MSKRGSAVLAQDIIEAIRRIELYTRDMDHEIFLQDIKTQDAVVRNIEIIGEAVKCIPESTRRENPAVPWKQIAGTRDRLIHEYFGINLDIVWNIIEKELPALLHKMQELFEGANG